MLRSCAKFLSTPSGWRATALVNHTRISPNRFLSTPSGWRATCRRRRRSEKGVHFYPRPPGGGRPLHGLATKAKDKFLSTPSGWRATEYYKVVKVGKRNFYPRPPGGGRPLLALHAAQLRKISIHALRVEGDRKSTRSNYDTQNFYPRPPGGGRLRSACSPLTAYRFLSTPSGWRATVNADLAQLVKQNISIHALRVEGDRG